MDNASKRCRKADERNDARQRATALRARLPFVSKSALGRLAGDVRAQQLFDIRCRNGIRAARNGSVKRATPFGALHQRLTIGDPFVLEYQHDMAVLYTFCKESKNQLEHHQSRKACGLALGLRRVPSIHFG